MTFESMGLEDKLIEAMSYMGFKNATPIQQAALPKVFEGKDLIACAQTGTGKTGAFLIPVLNEICKNDNNHIQAVIIVPTRELAIQIDEQIQGLSYFTGINSIAMYGGGKGGAWSDEKEALAEGCHIVVATPGKLIAHLNMGDAKLDYVKHVILDEADRMLDIGFHDDILRILSYLPKKRQTLLFSATMPPKIRTFANAILKKPDEINLSISKPAAGVKQQVFLTYDAQKIALIEHLLKEESRAKYDSIIIFSSTKKKVFQIVRQLGKTFESIQGISSDLEQDKREECVIKFKAKEIRIVVATDVLSRGIDVKDINLVINYDVPKAAEDYVHRVGRTARANTKGEAITLVNEDDMFGFSKIEILIEREFEKQNPPEEIGDGPEWNTKKRRFPSRNDRKGNNQRRNNKDHKDRKPNEQRKKRPYNKNKSNRKTDNESGKNNQTLNPEDSKSINGQSTDGNTYRKPTSKRKPRKKPIQKEEQSEKSENRTSQTQDPKNDRKPRNNNRRKNPRNTETNKEGQDTRNQTNRSNAKKPYKKRKPRKDWSKESNQKTSNNTTIEAKEAPKKKRGFFARLFGIK